MSRMKLNGPDRSTRRGDSSSQHKDFCCCSLRRERSAHKEPNNKPLWLYRCSGGLNAQGAIGAFSGSSASSASNLPFWMPG